MIFQSHVSLVRLENYLSGEELENKDSGNSSPGLYHEFFKRYSVPNRKKNKTRHISITKLKYHFIFKYIFPLPQTEEELIPTTMTP